MPNERTLNTLVVVNTFLCLKLNLKNLNFTENILFSLNQANYNYEREVSTNSLNESNLYYLCGMRVMVGMLQGCIECFEEKS